MAGFRFSSFYCMNCGNMVLEIPRKKSKLKKKFHRKKLYCPHCKTEVNSIECRDPFEVLEFKEAFGNGEYEQEAKESLDFIWSTRIRQVNLGKIN